MSTQMPVNNAAPVVVGGSQNGKTPVSNGKVAVPTAPPVVRGSSNSGLVVDHSRKSSVTFGNVSAPSTINGGPVGKPALQFGYESPAMPHSTPQIGGAAPIPIPGGNPRIASPAHSPSPIPQIPVQSGGQRAPGSGTQATLTFGSFPGDSGVSCPETQYLVCVVLVLTALPRPT